MLDSTQRYRSQSPVPLSAWLIPYIMEAQTGIEPANNGFADRPLSRLGTEPCYIDR